MNNKISEGHVLPKCSVYLILPAALGPAVYSVSKKRKTILGSKARPVHKVNNLTTIWEPIVYTMWIPQHLITYSPPLPVTGIALLYFTFLL
jgi:hypothetical protein